MLKKAFNELIVIQRDIIYGLGEFINETASEVNQVVADIHSFVLEVFSDVGGLFCKIGIIKSYYNAKEISPKSSNDKTVTKISSLKSGEKRDDKLKPKKTSLKKEGLDKKLSVKKGLSREISNIKFNEGDLTKERDFEMPINPISKESFLILNEESIKSNQWKKEEKISNKIIPGIIKEKDFIEKSSVKKGLSREISNIKFNEGDLTKERDFEMPINPISKESFLILNEESIKSNQWKKEEKISNKIIPDIIKEKDFIEKPSFYSRIKLIKPYESGDCYNLMQCSEGQAFCIDDLILKYTAKHKKDKEGVEQIVKKDGKTEITLNVLSIKKLKELGKNDAPNFLKEMYKKRGKFNNDKIFFRSLGLIEVLCTEVLCTGDHSKRMITECVLRPSLWTHGIYYPIWYFIGNKFVKVMHKYLKRDIEEFGINVSRNPKKNNGNKKFMFKEYFFKGFSMALGIDKKEKKELEKHFDKMERKIKGIKKGNKTKYVSTFTVEDTREFLKAIFKR